MNSASDRRDSHRTEAGRSCRRATGAGSSARSRCRAPVRRSRSRIEIDDLLDRAATYGTERYVVAREHDAVGLRAKGAPPLIVSPLERADPVRMRTFVEQR